jgi:hypothetical protein
MKPVVNIQEGIGKIVGQRTPRKNTLAPVPGEIEDVKAWRAAFPTLFVPRGVYRFRSHEEADEWLWKMLTRKKDQKRDS